jgi:hypothetical protein
MYHSMSREMTFVYAVMVVAGIGIIVLGCRAKNFYYGPGPYDPPAPLWLGRLSSMIVGSILIVEGLHALFVK